MITFADESMLPLLTRIWQDSFGDSEEYIDMFLKDNFTRIKTIVWEEQGKPVSAAYFLTMTYVKPHTTERQACLYLYAAATLPAYRGKGYFGEILKFVKEHFTEPVLLVPGEPSLAGYYQKNGLEVCQKERYFTCTKEAFSCEIFGKYVVEVLSSEVYFQYREKALRHTPHMCWELPFMTYICKENRYCNGSQIRLSFEGSDLIVMFRQEESELQILELLCFACDKDGTGGMVQKELMHKAIQILMCQTGCITAKVCVQPTVMCNDLVLKKESFYFNLTLG